jgi:hypothetical protein
MSKELAKNVESLMKKSCSNSDQLLVAALEVVVAVVVVVVLELELA